MIKANICRDDNKKIYGYNVEGHANFGEYGKDIVCAAVSTLTQNSLLSLLRLLDFKKDDIKYKIDDEIGYIDVKFKDGSEYDTEKAQILLESLVLGLDYIQESYPDYVTLNDEGV